MADVVSKNMYELLGNDPEEDSDREPEPPTKAKDKPIARSGKRDAVETAPAKATPAGGDSRGGGRGGRGRGRGGNDSAYFDRSAGRDANRSNADYVNQTDRPHRGGRGDRGGRGRGGRDVRGGRGERIRDDRHSHGRPNEHDKQTDQSWGANTGGAEWDDEKAGEAIAQEDAKDGTDANVEAPVNADGQTLDETAAAEPAEPEEVQKTWDQYLSEQAEKKLALGSNLDARKPNEGSKADKKWANAKALNKDDEEDEYIKGGAGKTQRTRERKEKQTLEIDHRYQESSRGSGERGRGRGRGEGYRNDRGTDRGRGRGRGDRGDRGGYRGDRADRGNTSRGGRGNSTVNANDESAFPKLGA